jgi:hypothetical protein
MKAVLDLIADYGAAVRQYESALPCASGEWRDTLLWHRDLNLRIIADLRRLLSFFADRAGNPN